MGKAALVIETPDSCSKCKLSYEFEGIKKCRLLNVLQNGGKAIIPKDKYAKYRHEECPLVELPEKLDGSRIIDEYDDGYTDGWNDYFDNIVGVSQNT